MAEEPCLDTGILFSSWRACLRVYVRVIVIPDFKIAVEQTIHTSSALFSWQQMLKCILKTREDHWLLRCFTLRTGNHQKSDLHHGWRWQGAPKVQRCLWWKGMTKVAESTKPPPSFIVSDTIATGIGVSEPALLCKHMAVWEDGKKRGRQAGLAWAWGEPFCRELWAGEPKCLPLFKRALTDSPFLQIFLEMAQRAAGVLGGLDPHLYSPWHFSAPSLPLSCPALCWSPGTGTRMFVLEKWEMLPCPALPGPCSSSIFGFPTLCSDTHFTLLGLLHKVRGGCLVQVTCSLENMKWLGRITLK